MTISGTPFIFSSPTSFQTPNSSGSTPRTQQVDSSSNNLQSTPQAIQPQKSESPRPVEPGQKSERQNPSTREKQESIGEDANRRAPEDLSDESAIELRPLVVEQTQSREIRAFQTVAQFQDGFQIIDTYA